MTQLLFLLCCSPAHADSRRVSVVIDTSGSMDDNDPTSDAVLASLILYDLLRDQDAFSLVQMQSGSRCRAGQLLEPSGARAAAKRRLAKHGLDDGPGTHFESAVNCAVDHVGPDGPRLVVVLSDAAVQSKDWGNAKRTLQAASNDSTTVALVRIGSGAVGQDAFTGPDFIQADAKKPSEIIKALATVYQAFLGLLEPPQNGLVRGNQVEVKVEPYTSQAWLVVAGSGAFSLSEAAGNPGARAVDLDFRGGGDVPWREDPGVRSYEMVRLEHPRPGTWNFELDAAPQDGGWLLIVEHALEPVVRVPDKVFAGQPTPVTVELVDTRDGSIVTDPKMLEHLSVDIEGGQMATDLRDDGTGPDASAGDGILTGEWVFEAGDELAIGIRTETIERLVQISPKVVEVDWFLQSDLPTRTRLGEALSVRVEARASSPDASELAPDSVLEANRRIQLAPGPAGSFEGSWTPQELGPQTLVFQVPGRPDIPELSHLIEVVGELRLGAADSLDLGPIRGGDEGVGAITLPGAVVVGDFSVDVQCDCPGSVDTEFFDGADWVPAKRGVRLPLGSGEEPQIQVRVRVPECASNRLLDQAGVVHLVAQGPNGPLNLDVPLSVTVLPDPFLSCWWRELLGLATAIVGFLAARGFWVGAVFRPELSVYMWQPADGPNSGYAVRLRGRGYGRKRWYRASQAHLHEFRVLRTARGAVARLTARPGGSVELKPLQALLIEQPDGEREDLPLGETHRVRFRTPYYNASGSFAFEFRRS